MVSGAGVCVCGGVGEVSRTTSPGTTVGDVEVDVSGRVCLAGRDAGVVVVAGVVVRCGVWIRAARLARRVLARELVAPRT